MVAHFDTLNMFYFIQNNPSYIITIDDVDDMIGLPLNLNTQKWTRSKKNENEVDEWLGKIGFVKLEIVKI